MFARVASFEGGDTERLRELNEERLLNDEQGGRRLFIAFFDSREALDAAQSQFESMGDEIPEEVRGRRTAVDAYEVLYDGEP